MRSAASCSVDALQQRFRNRPLPRQGVPKAVPEPFATVPCACQSCGNRKRNETRAHSTILNPSLPGFNGRIGPRTLDPRGIGGDPCRYQGFTKESKSTLACSSGFPGLEQCERAGNVAVTMFTLAYTTSASSPATRSNVCLWDATMSGWAELLPVTARLLKVSLVATFAASLVLGSSSMGIAADDWRPEQVRAAEQRLLGSDDEAARFAACQPFTREIAAEGAVEESFDASLIDAGVPAAARLEMQRAFAAAIDLGREVAAGDRFYVRYEQTFTALGAPIGIARVLWAELVTRSRGPLAIHRFHPRGGVEHFWLANGEAAMAPSMRLPLDAVTVSSGFGMRADPFDQPPPSKP